MYIFGGMNAECKLLHDLAIFDIKSSHWLAYSNTDDWPMPRVWHSVVAASADLVVLPGGLASGNLDMIWTLDTTKIDYLQEDSASLGSTLTTAPKQILRAGTNLFPAFPDQAISATSQVGKFRPHQHIESIPPKQSSGGSIFSMATEVSTVSDSHIVSNTLELNVYHAKPNQHKSSRREARLDTQAYGNFISETFVEFLDYTIRPYDGNGFRSALGNIVPIGEVSIFFDMQPSKKLKKRRFLVLEDSEALPCDLILGIKFISEFNLYNFDGSLLILALAPMSSEEQQLVRNTAVRQEQQRKEDMRKEEEENRVRREARRQEMRQQQTPQQSYQSRW
ncbi:hypothetical protein N7G274_002319 [Stereocaulon virgatum]|uniref:Uncharacterized protein n=1 Tax=Stereocaulon virgatum TaxID=373712 RepID=A0ABR4AIA2_9LECA